MKSPENKTIALLFWSVPGTHADHLWKVRVTVPPSATAETPLVLAAEGENSVPIAKASFEITTKNLMIAAMSGVVDDIAGVAESIIVGQPVTLGTGAVNLIYTPKKKGDEQ